MRCLNCKTENNGEAKFCKLCGKELTDKALTSYVKRKELFLFWAVLLVLVIIFVGIQIGLIGKSSSEKFMEYIKRQEYEAAEEIYYKKIQDNDKQLNLTEELVAEELQNVVESYYAGEITFIDANTQVEQYIEFFPQMVNAKRMEIDALNQSHNDFSMAESLYKEADYLMAREYYARVIPTDANYIIANQKSEECYEKYIADLHQQISVLEEAEDYQQAISLCNSEEVNLEDKDREWLYSRKAELESKYVEQIINVINAYLGNREIEEAEKYVNNALNSYPQNSDLLELRDIVSEYYPDYLGKSLMTETDMSEERSAPYYKYNYAGPIYDTSGNYYENANFYWTSDVYSKQDEIIYDFYGLNGEYVHFSAVLAPQSGWQDVTSDEGTYFYIVADENILFASYIDKRTEPIPIELDITNVTELKIGMVGGRYVKIILADPYIYKRY